MLNLPELEAVGDMVIVAVSGDLLVSPGGVLLSEAHSTKLNRGIVLSVGSRVRGDITPGQSVHWMPHRGSEFKAMRLHDEILTIHEDDLLAVSG